MVVLCAVSLLAVVVVAVGCWLLVVGCWLLVVGCWLKCVVLAWLVSWSVVDCLSRIKVGFIKGTSLYSTHLTLPSPLPITHIPRSPYNPYNTESRIEADWAL